MRRVVDRGATAAAGRVMPKATALWQPRARDRAEQAATLRALESGRFDGMSDEEWCAHLARVGEGGLRDCG